MAVWVINRRDYGSKMTPEQRALLEAEYPSHAKDGIVTAILVAALFTPIVAATVAAGLVSWLSDAILPQIHRGSKTIYSKP